VIETDGAASHDPRHDADRRRWTALQAAGHLLAVLSFDDVEHRPAAVRIDTAAILALAVA
jgi:very-short-patch-repair endonuclease